MQSALNWLNKLGVSSTVRLGGNLQFPGYRENMLYALCAVPYGECRVGRREPGTTLVEQKPALCGGFLILVVFMAFVGLS